MRFLAGCDRCHWVAGTLARKGFILAVLLVLSALAFSYVNAIARGRIIHSCAIIDTGDGDDSETVAHSQAQGYLERSNRPDLRMLRFCISFVVADAAPRSPESVRAAVSRGPPAA